MSRPFDATMKNLGADYPYTFLETFDCATTEPTRSINVDFSTIMTAADVVFGLGQPLCAIVYIDFQAAVDSDKGADVLVYNGLLYRHSRMPIHSIPGC